MASCDPRASPGDAGSAEAISQVPPWQMGLLGRGPNHRVLRELLWRSLEVSLSASEGSAIPNEEEKRC